MKYELSDNQYDFVTSNALHSGMVGGYGSGKTFAGILKTVSKKMEYPNIDVAYYLPTYGLIKDIAFPNIANILENQGIRYFLHETDKVFNTDFGRIIMRSMEKPANIVGYEVGYSLVDEIDLLSKEKAKDAVTKIIGRNRSVLPDGSKNLVDFVSTPEGFRFLHEFFVENKTDNRRIIHAKTQDNKHVSKSYIDSLKESYTAEQLRAYLNGEFINFNAGTVFYKFNRLENNSDRVIKPNDVLHIGMDFNITNMSCIVHVKDGHVVTAVDELLGVFDTAAMIELIKVKYPKHRINIYPNASGNNRRSAGQSDIDLLKKERFTVIFDRRNPLVKDRVTKANKGFEDKLYAVNVSRCKKYVDALERLAYKNGEPDKASGYDHAPDAGTYAYFNIGQNVIFNRLSRPVINSIQDINHYK